MSVLLFHDNSTNDSVLFDPLNDGLTGEEAASVHH